MALPGKNLISEKEIFDYLMTKPGMTEVKAAGIVANIAKESLYYADAVQMGDVENPGIGLFQYTFKARKDAFLKAVPDWKTNWKGQIDFAFEENEFKSFMKEPYETVQDSTRGFMTIFEKPKDQSEEEVQDRVNRLYNSPNIKDDLQNLPKNKTDEMEFVDVPEEDDIDVLPVLEKIESKKIEPNAFSAGIKTNHTIQLGIGILRDGTFEGGLTKEQEEKLEELGIQVSSRQQGNAVIYEIETKSLNEANKLRKKIDETNIFDKVFTKHFKVNEDGSQDRITDDQLYRFTGRKSYKYDPAKDEKINLPGEPPPLGSVYKGPEEKPEQEGEKEKENVIVLDPDGKERVITIEKTKPVQKPTNETDELEFVDVPEDDDPDDFSKLQTKTTETTDLTQTTPEKKSLTDTLGGAASLADSAFTAASRVLDGIGGPGALVSYVLGKRALKDAMQEVQPQKRADLSPLFYEQYRQSKELAKQGFAPNEERAIRERIDDAYQVGLENAVRGTAGNRARFLAQSGVLDSARSSALLNFAAQDDQLRRQNQKEFTDLMMFKENFDQQRSEQQRAEDMRLQLQDKSAAGQFAAQAFSNVLSGLSGNNALLKRAFGNLQSGGFSPTSIFSN